MLQTARCILSSLEETDFDGVERLYTNVAVRKYLGGPVDPRLVKENFNRIHTSPATGTHLVARTKDTEQFIGLLSLSLHHDGVSTEISYMLLPHWWEKGYGQECVKAAIDFASQQLQLTELIAETQAANLSSCRLLEKLGFQAAEHLERFGAPQIIYKIAL